MYIFSLCAGIKDAKVSIIGAGKMTKLLLHHLESQGVTKVTIVNRSLGSVEALQTEFPNLVITAKLMDELYSCIAESDIVFPSTSALEPIITPTELTESLSHRTRSGGVQIIDISVPRNVHADCAAVQNVACYNVDDLNAVVNKNTAKRRKEMIEAEYILKEEMGKFRQWQQSLGAIPTIARLQAKAETMRLEELTKASKKLSSLTPKDFEIVEKVTKGEKLLLFVS